MIMRLFLVTLLLKKIGIVEVNLPPTQGETNAGFKLHLLTPIMHIKPLRNTKFILHNQIHFSNNARKEE